MWPERLAIISVFLLVTAALTAENLDRWPPSERHSWFAVFTPIFLLQALFLAMLIATCVGITRALIAPPPAVTAGNTAKSVPYVDAGLMRTEAAERRRQGNQVPDTVWGSVFLVLWFVWTLLLACKLNAIDDIIIIDDDDDATTDYAAVTIGSNSSDEGGPSWGAVFGVLIALEALLTVFWLVTAMMACLHQQHPATAATTTAYGQPPGCAGSFGRCKCAQALWCCVGAGGNDDGGLDAVDGTQELALYGLLVALVVSTVLWMIRVETAPHGIGMGLVFTPLFIALALLFLNGLFLVIRLRRHSEGEGCYDWTVTILYVVAIALLLLFLALFAAASDASGRVEGWHGVFAPLYVLFGAASVLLCVMVVSLADDNIRRQPGDANARKWGPLVLDEFGVPATAGGGGADVIDTNDDGAFDDL